jgi:hypothetical protein
LMKLAMIGAGNVSGDRRRTVARRPPSRTHAMLWIDQVLQRGRGADFAFALTRRSG